MKRRSAWIATIIGISTILFFVRFLSLETISAEACARIKEGMTEEEVEILLGRRCDSCYPLVGPPVRPGEVFDECFVMASTWHGAAGDIHILFSAPAKSPEGTPCRVAIVEFMAKQEPLLQKIKRWLGL